MRIPIIICSATLLCAANAFGSKHYQLTSPSGVISSTINCDKELTYSVKYDNEEVISESPISITLTDGSVWGPDARISKPSRDSPLMAMAWHIVSSTIERIR